MGFSPREQFNAEKIIIITNGKTNDKWHLTCPHCSLNSLPVALSLDQGDLGGEEHQRMTTTEVQLMAELQETQEQLRVELEVTRKQLREELEEAQRQLLSTPLLPQEQRNAVQSLRYPGSTDGQTDLLGDSGYRGCRL